MGNPLSVLFAGDVCTNANAALCHGAYAKEVLSEVKPYLDRADYRIVNLENPIAPEGVGAPIPKSGPNLIGRPANLDFFREGSFDCCVLANNHLGDFGTEAVLNTLRLLEENQFGYVGGGRNLEEAYRAWYIEEPGIRIAVLAACENEFGTADGTTPGAAGFDLKRIRDRICEEKKGADFVVVVFHGGNEQNPVPSPGACDRYRLFCDFGADAVVAMHTHCPQGYEVYEGKPIIYSMGNFYFPKLNYMDFAPDAPWFFGYLTQLFFEKGENVRFAVIPYRVNPEGTRISVFCGKEKEAFLDYLKTLSEIIQNPAEVRRLYEGWCTYAGLAYARLLSYRREYEDAPEGETMRELCVTKNLFSCEAHNELCKTTLNLLYQGRLEEAEQAYEELRELSKMPR